MNEPEGETIRMCFRPTRHSDRLPWSGLPWSGLAARAVCAAVVVFAAGCTQLDLADEFSWPWAEPEPRTPTRMVNTWTDTVLQQPGKPGVRGFGGRIMFFEDGREKPIKVDGTLTVYAFDDADPDPNKPPEKKYLFLADQLPKHYSKSKVGHSYSFWLPWDDAGGYERQIGLVVRFEDREGKVVMSPVAHKTLPGRQPVPKAEDDPAGTISRLDESAVGHVRQVAHQEPIQPARENRARMKTTTIELTSSFAERLAAASKAQSAEGAQANTPTERTGTADLAEAPVTAESQAERSTGSSESPEEPPEPSSADSSSEPASARPSRSAHPAHSRFQAPEAAGGEPASSLLRCRPRPARWPSPLPRTPRPKQFQHSLGSTPADSSGGN
jgi:hypothetical protein